MSLLQSTALLFVGVIATLNVVAQSESPCTAKGYVGNAVSGVSTRSGSKDIQTDATPETHLKLSQDQTVRIVSKPIAVRTDKQDCSEGFVYLRIQFLSSGKIGKITVVSGLTIGLNRDAIDAAKKIRFEVSTKNGRPITVFKTMRYSFTIY